MGSEKTGNYDGTRNVGNDDDDDFELDDGFQHSLPSPPTQKKKGNETLMMISGIAGNVLEWYDFAVFGYFSEEISEIFFPPQDGNAALIETFTIFGLAFLMRPIGGMLLGYIGDTYGRKTALEISIFLMAFPTFALGLLPTYDQVGPLAFILLIIVRLFQGVSVGGQLISSLVFTVESKPKEKWGLYGSYVMAGANCGCLLGNIVSSALRIWLSPEQLIGWGWRVPFLLGVLASIPGIYLKFYCEEEGAPVGHSNNGEPPENSIKASFRKENLRALFSSTLVPMLWAGGFYLVFVWMAVFMDKLSENKVPGAFQINCVSLFISVILLFPLCGMLSDKFGRTKIMYIGAVGILVSAPILMHVISLGEAFPALCAQTSLGILLSLWGGPMLTWLAESFEPELRQTAVSIGFNIAQALIGGNIAAIATALITFGPMAPGFFLSGLALLGIIGLYIAPKHEKETDSQLPQLRSAEEVAGFDQITLGETTSLKVPKID